MIVTAFLEAFAEIFKWRFKRLVRRFSSGFREFLGARGLSTTIQGFYWLLQGYTVLLHFFEEYYWVCIRVS